MNFTQHSLDKLEQYKIDSKQVEQKSQMPLHRLYDQ